MRNSVTKIRYTPISSKKKIKRIFEDRYRAETEFVKCIELFKKGERTQLDLVRCIINYSYSDQLLLNESIRDQEDYIIQYRVWKNNNTKENI